MHAVRATQEIGSCVVTSFVDGHFSVKTKGGNVLAEHIDVLALWRQFPELVPELESVREPVWTSYDKVDTGYELGDFRD